MHYDNQKLNPSVLSAVNDVLDNPGFYNPHFVRHTATCLAAWFEAVARGADPKLMSLEELSWAIASFEGMQKSPA